ncbi:MAG: ThiF family adenylyltransferase [Xanthomonadales bacterium]|nr:ThiF family adenylyltransferase [Xanthomonadales bacterium]
MIRINWDIIAEIYYSIGQRPAEAGGVLGSGGNRIDHFVFEETSRNSPVTYTPDHQKINRLFDETWGPKGIRLKGFAHSHPPGAISPSGGDLDYAKRILRGIEDLDELFLPIIQTVPDRGVFTVHPWSAVAEEVVRLVPTQILLQGDDDGLIRLLSPELRSRLEAEEPLDCLMLDPARQRKPFRRTASGAQASTNLPTRSQIFERVTDAYDLERMRQSRLVVVGAGGAADWIESMARAGIEQFVLIDPDTVAIENVATQQVYLKDVDRPKVDCISERIAQINPHAKVTALTVSLDDLNDEQFRALCQERLDGLHAGQTLICGFTDSFPAQARVNRLGLNLGLPTLSAQVYLEGRGAEVTFSYPGVTPACQRCVTGGRYRHIREHAQRDDISSRGTPIFATDRLNAIKGFVALAILHHGTTHPRWGGLLARIGNRNLVQLRLDPDLAQSVGLAIFDEVTRGADKSRLLFDDVVWLPQEPENPQTGFEPCEDCGGCGDLRLCEGQFESTQIAIWRVAPDTEDAPATDLDAYAETTAHHAEEGSCAWGSGLDARGESAVEQVDEECADETVS